MMSPEDQKKAIKEGLQEWLDDKFVEFGKLSMKGIIAILLVSLVYLWSIKKLLGQPVMITVGVLIALPISPVILYLIYKWTT